MSFVFHRPEYFLKKVKHVFYFIVWLKDFKRVDMLSEEWLIHRRRCISIMLIKNRLKYTSVFNRFFISLVASPGNVFPYDTRKFSLNFPIEVYQFTTTKNVFQISCDCWTRFLNSFRYSCVTHSLPCLFQGKVIKFHGCRIYIYISEVISLLSKFELRQVLFWIFFPEFSSSLKNAKAYLTPRSDQF